MYVMEIRFNCVQLFPTTVRGHIHFHGTQVHMMTPVYLFQPERTVLPLQTGSAAALQELFRIRLPTILHLILVFNRRILHSFVREEMLSSQQMQDLILTAGLQLQLLLPLMLRRPAFTPLLLMMVRDAQALKA